MHEVKAMSDVIILSKKLPPDTREIKYNEIVSVEHRRIPDYGRLTGVAIALILAYVITSVQFVKDIISQLVLEVGHATGSITETSLNTTVRAQGEQVGLYIAAILVVVAGYYMIKFAFSLGQRFVFYRTGRKPISIPLPLTGESMELLATINKKVKAVASVSKQEVEKIIGDQIRSMLDERMDMQKKMLDSLKMEALTVKTDEDKAKLRAKIDESVAKLEAQDEQIDRELKKTGLSKDDIFKKYRIKAPKDEFVDAIMKEGGIDKI